MPPMRRRKETTEMLTVVLEELSYAGSIVLCAFYISWWRIKHYIWYDPKLKRGSLIAAALCALILFLDVLLFSFGKEVPVWLGRSAIFFLVPTAILLAVHRVAEAGKEKGERTFADRIGPLADALTDLSGIKPQDRDEALTNFVSKLLGQVHAEFTAVKKEPVTVSVMSRHTDGKLRIAYLFPLGTPYDPNVGFEPGEGGAGYCFKENTVVYIPSIRYTHGITISVATEGKKVGFRYGLKRRLYVPIAEEFEVYESFLCLPVTSPKETHAVMNVDSKDRDAFDMRDVHTLRAYARILGDGISLCARQLETKL
jgi:hypothetical protein